MSTATRLAGFAAILLVVVAGAFGVGKAVGPVTAVAEQAHDGAAGHGSGAGSNEPAGPDAAADSTAAAIGGLTSSERGYSLILDSPILPSGATDVTFRIAGPDGRPVTRFDEIHDKQMHLIAVRTDTFGFQHVHPTMNAAGTWTVPLGLTAGGWRIFTDIQPTDLGATLTLGVNLSVPGDYQPRPLPKSQRSAEIDGYTVTLNGDLVAGRMSELTLSVSRGGTPVTDLQPYLAAYGHLVALRANDLAYLHVHPKGEPGDGITPAGPDITFGATAPSAGTYRLYLDFQHNDVVRTAEFTVTVGDTETPVAPTGSGATTTSADHSGH